MFSLYLSNREDMSGQMEFTDVDGILLDSDEVLLDLFKIGR
jgi:hypothetical protein